MDLEVKQEEEEEEVERNLHALRKLYGLLQTSNDDATIDDRARMLFKNLLDAARYNFLNAQSQIIAARSDTPCSSKAIQTTALSTQKPPISSKPSTTSLIQSNIYINNASKLDHDQSLLIKPSPIEAFSKQSRLSISSQERKKRCRVCQKRNVRPQKEDSNYTDEHGGVIGQAIDLSGGLNSATSNKQEDTADFSKQVSNSIKLIESSILALQGIVDPRKVTSTPEMQSKVAETATLGHTKKERLPTLVKRMTRHDKVAQAVELLCSGQSQNMNFTSGAPSQVNEALTYQYVHGLRIPSSQDDRVTNNSSHTVNMKKKKKKKHNQTTQDNSPLHDSVKKLLIKPMLLGYESPPRHKSEHLVGRKRGMLAKKKTLPYHQERDQISMSNSTSSYSLTSRPDTKPSTTSATTSANSIDNMSRQLQDETPYNSIYDSRSNSSSIFSSGSYNNADAGHRKISNPDKAIGRLKRFKNKLRLIFHHHHHHHHHHHQQTDTPSMWKNIHKMLIHRDKQQVYEKKAVGKVRKSALSQNNQVGQFQAMVKGLMRHVRHSKKSNLPKKGGIQRGHKQHLWKMFQRQRGVKLTKKGRVRLQLPVRSHR